MNWNLYYVFSSARICTAYDKTSTCQSQVPNSTPSCPTMDVELLDVNRNEQVYEKQILVCEVDDEIQICLLASQLASNIIKFEYDAENNKCHNPYM